jgi:2',3'-cyclic-nucleotide 2'-phosphodiesterase (5'-nucleotidase family)
MKRLLKNGILLLMSLALLFAGGRVSRAEAVFGDADGDGELTAQDASCINRHLNRFQMMDAAALTRADLDGDGSVTAIDASLIMSAAIDPEDQVVSTAAFSLLVTSDMRGNAWDPAATDESASCTAMNVTACVKALREAEPDLLLLDAGGSLFGSSIADDYPERTNRSYGPVTTLFIQMQYDAVLLGDEALSYPSQTVRREVNELEYRKIAVLGANLQKSLPTVFDPEGVLWNDLLPYVILTVPQGEDREPVRVAVIGVTEPDLAVYDDEVLAVDPLDSYLRIREEVQAASDYTILLYHGNTEVDESGKTGFSLRDMLCKTDGIDLVLAAHGAGNSVRSERNASGVEVPIVSLPGGTETVTRVDVSLRGKGRPAIALSPIDTRAYAPDDDLKKLIRPYASSMSGMMDAAVCTVTGPVEGYTRDGRLSSTDSMELLHEMQIFAAKCWIDYCEIDLPNTIVSVAYPYFTVDGFREGTLCYGDLYRIKTETPNYTLLLVRAGELKAWLSAYAETIMTDETVYSLYGVSYLINTLNPESPLGFMEYSSGQPVEDDEVFALILAEDPEGGPVIRPYLDESWMTYEDRVVEGFTLPEPYALTTAGTDPIIDALAAYLEDLGELKLNHTFSWIAI